MGDEQPAKFDALVDAQIGNYVVRAKLGEGGMGTVYLAEHPRIGKKVALKVLHSEFANNREIVERFFTEAKAVNDIGHPNIVDIIDYGETTAPNGEEMVYFIMEHLDGRSLEDIIEEQAPLEPSRCVHICTQIADALHASHQAHIVHRDLKPDNVILVPRRTTKDFVKLLDFGIAKLTNDQPGSKKTRTGIVMGTPVYMSPEQCEGRQDKLDHRTDIYALGILMYQMLTGTVPFMGDGYGEIIVQHVTRAPARLSSVCEGIPLHLELVCLRALEKRPEDRYDSMGEFMAALADPVGFVNEHGGAKGFLSPNLGAAMPAPSLAGSTLAIEEQTPLNASAEAADEALVVPKDRRLVFAAGFASLVLVAAFAVWQTRQPDAGTDKSGQKTAEPESLVQGQGQGHDSAASVVDRISEPPTAMANTKGTQEVTEADKPVALSAIGVSVGVDSNPPGADIFVHGKRVGKTPHEFHYTADKLPIAYELKMKGYGDAQVEVDYNERTPGQKYTLSPTLKKNPKRAPKRSHKTARRSRATGTPTPTVKTGPKDPTDLLVPGQGAVTKKRTKARVGDDTVAPTFD